MNQELNITELKTRHAIELRIASGEPWQYRVRASETWIDGVKINIPFNWTALQYRITPKPKMRIRRADEIPLGAWLKSTSGRMLLVVETGGELICFGRESERVTTLIKHGYQLSLDRGVTFHGWEVKDV